MKSHTILQRLIFFLFLIISISGCNPEKKNNTISLEGTWRFQIDSLDLGIQESWYNGKLPGSIELPGSMAENGKGNDVSTHTKWTGQIVDKSWYTDDKYKPYRQSGNIKIPYWLTPVKHYIEPAWYQKEILIPGAWDDAEKLLFLERTHWETQVWLDGQKIGQENSLSTPNIFNLGKVKPGNHILTLRIDNSVNIDVGINAHSISDHTQTNWNGVIGRIELQKKNQIQISDIQIFPDINARAVRIKLKIDNTTGKSTEGLITLEAKSYNSKRNHQPEKITQKINIRDKKCIATLTYPLGKDVMLWDEFDPALYKLSIQLEGSVKNSSFADAKVTSFGMREFRVDGTQFSINGKKIFLRGTLECCIFPFTGYPPMDLESWLKNLKIVKDFGLNHIRFHSWCPPEAAFEAADRLGIYFQVECGAWARIGDGETVDQFIMQESERIVRTYGNHPSFCMMAYGNEPAGQNQVKYLSDFIQYWKSNDPRRVYTGAAGWPVLEVNDYHNIPAPRGHQWGANLTSRFNSEPLNREYDYRTIISRFDKPVVSHEIGQWCVYPDFKEIENYTGVLKAKNFEIYKDFLEKKGMLHQAEDFLIASGKWQTLLYKEEIETALRTPGFAGFQLLDLHDFPGQGTALVGMLNPFWETKGYVDAKEFRKFCSEIVPLVRMPKVAYLNSEACKIPVEIVNYGPQDIETEVKWMLMKDDGTIYSWNVFDPLTIRRGKINSIGMIEAGFGNILKATRLTLKVALAGTDYFNSWSLWVYPANKNDVVNEKILISHSLNETVKDALKNGEKVIFLAQPQSIRSNVPQGFTTIFWNTAWTRKQKPHTLGILCNPDHSALKEFPTDFFSNWQWFDPVTNARAVIMDSLPDNLFPIIQVIDDWNTNRKLGLLFEARVDNGKLLFCSIDLENNMDQRPVARQLLKSIKKYVMSENFNPQIKVTTEQLESLLKNP